MFSHVCYNLHGYVGVFISYHSPAVEVSHNNKSNVLSAVTMLWAVQSWIQIPAQARDIFTLQNYLIQ